MSERLIRNNSDRNFIALLESAPDSMVITGSDGKIMMINRQTETLFGYSRNEIIGKEIEILIPEKYHKTHRKERTIYHAKPRTRPMGTGIELFGRRKDGTDFPVEVSLSPLQWDNPGDLMIIASIRDVSKQKQAQAELAKRTRELEIINRELEAFSYSVSHDLRAPLRSIEAFSNKILAESASRLDEKSRDYFMRITRATGHMGQLINDLLKLSKISRFEFKPDCIDLSEIARAICNDLMESEPSRKVNFQLKPLIPACADRNLITIALQNLLNNAWKYTKKTENAFIEFGSEKKNEHTVYFIKDNGIGFNMKYAGLLFKAFQRLHTNSEFEGTGVGLAIVHRIIERHSGEVWVESEENKGSAFYFTLFEKCQIN